MRATAAYLILLLLTSAPALGQVNVEPLAAQAKEPGWGFQLKGGFGLAAGNVNYIDLRSAAALRFLTAHEVKPNERLWFKDRLLLFGSYGLKLAGGEGLKTSERVDNEGFVHLRYTRMFLPRVGMDVYGQLQFDEFLLLEWRVLGGVGARVVPVHSERFSLWLGSGYMAEYEVLNLPEDAPEDPARLNHRWSSYLTLYAEIVPGRLSLITTTYAQPRFDDLSDVRVLSESGLKIAVDDKLSIGIAVTLRHDSRPPVDLKPTDLRLVNNLAVTL